MMEFVYNKTALYNVNVISSGFFDSNSGKDDRSEELVKYNYNELCLDLDLFYGLKSEHGISSFDEYFKNTGLSTDLLGITDTDDKFTPASAEDFVIGMYNLIYGTFADFHSNFIKNSYYAGIDYSPDLSRINMSPSYLEQQSIMFSYKDVRTAAMSTALHEASEAHRKPGSGTVFDYSEYSSDGSEINDTAILTYDSFLCAGSSYSDYFTLTENGTKELSLDDVNDTIGLVIYAQQQINKNKNIKNVVIDLSCNGGGEIDSLMYICSWFLGQCKYNLRNSLTGALCTTIYTSDVDLNGTPGEDADKLSGLKEEDGETARTFNLYCIISPNSFSCANGLATMLKQSGKVTMLGKTSGGGACLVRPDTSADTCTFNISSCYQICTVKNGSFYQVDEGIVPDFAINDFSKTVYNRENLVKFISELD